MKKIFWGLTLVGLAWWIGCDRPPEREIAGEGFTYHPDRDPLVNPATLFEAPPEDLALIDTEDTLTIQLDGNPNTLHPFYVSLVSEFTIVNAIYAGLFVIDKDIQWHVNEDLVESWRESEDHREFIVRLKEGLTWQDGAAFTAHDVVYSWQKILDEQVPCFSQKPSTEPIAECVALDDVTVQLVQPRPLATARWNLLFPVIPKHIFEKDRENNPDLRSGEFYRRQSRRPVGNGAYRLVEWKEQDRVVLERWEDYAGSKPYFKRIVFRITPDKNMALLLFEKGELDVIERLSPQQFARETASELFQKVGRKGWQVGRSYGYIGWNMDGSNPFFTDQQVRGALTQALNVPLILDKVFYNLAAPCAGIFPPGEEWYNPQVKRWTYDLNRATTLLDQAGWQVDEADGKRYKQIDGQKVGFEFTLLLAQNAAAGEQIGTIFQEELKKLGIRMNLHIMEWSVYLEKLRSHEFEAMLGSWNPGLDPDWQWSIWRTEGYESGRNYIGYSNPQVDELFAAARREFDIDARRKIYQQIHHLTYDDQPYTWIYQAPILSVFHQRIGGVQFSPRGIFGFYPSHLQWWAGIEIQN